MNNKKQESFFLSEKFLSKLPLTFLFLIFLIPIVILKINYKVGLYFIAFYVSYWTVKAFESYIYIIASYIKLLKVNKKDYIKTKVIKEDAKKLKHVVIVPIYSEPFSVIEDNILSIIANDFPYMENITVLLATEERGPNAIIDAELIIERFKNSPIKIVNIIHPSGLKGEGKVKGSNISYAVKKYEELVELDENMTLIHTIDTDTKVEKNFFLITSFFFLTVEKPNNAIYQYTPVYSNNWSKGTFFARLIAMGTTFWQLSESQNPEFYRNFAVYGQSLHCLKKSDYWSKTSIVEDGFQYWRSYFAFDGVFRIVNVPAVCRMDIVEEVNLYRTIKSQYKQLRRWSWGCTDIEFVIPEFFKNKKIKLYEKLRKTIYLALNHAFWAGGSIMLFVIGYFPGIFDHLKNSTATLAVPLSTSIIFTWIFATIAFPSIASVLIMRKYTHFRKRDYILNIFQWITIPILALTLFSIPAIESQIRLFFGKRIDSFETTAKMKR
ncbi:MAG: glycosyltransferase family 2 protein [Candidatus Gracilibacteria bacterium]|nr:glycosyltransferase family 2 protein [Candidatus Gracilibacteria bacterium]MDD2908522.1 glycosyltransferase family 2 protein [Candidatus Gracilibacteria bacterium]